MSLETVPSSLPYGFTLLVRASVNGLKNEIEPRYQRVKTFLPLGWLLANFIACSYMEEKDLVPAFVGISILTQPIVAQGKWKRGRIKKNDAPLISLMGNDGSKRFVLQVKTK